jgi:hypothetical protein
MKQDRVAFKGDWDFSVRKSFILDPDLSMGAKMVYLAIRSHCSPNGETAFPSAVYISKCLSISRDTFYKYLTELKLAGWISAVQKGEDGKFSHTVYTVFQNPCKTVRENHSSPQRKKPATEKPDTKTSHKNEDFTVTEETKETPTRVGVDISRSTGGSFKPVAKPSEEEKQRRLWGIKLPKSSEVPSQTEFDDFLDSEAPLVAAHRIELYDELLRNKWCHWSSLRNRWERIRNWRSYVSSLAAKMEDAQS